MKKSTEEEIVDRQVDKMGGKCNPDEKDQFRQILGDVVFKGLTIMEAIKMPPALVELIFSYANDLYAAEKYSDANKLYYFILQLNHQDPRFLFAYAASFHKLKKYKDAANYYLLCGSAHSNPLAWYHCADCYIQLREYEVAKAMLNKAIASAGDSSEHEKIKQQAAGLISAIENAQGGSA